MEFWWILVLLIIIYLIWAENGSQNCYERECNNLPPKVNSDSYLENISRVIETIRLNHTYVDWRRAMLIALILAFIIPIVLSVVFNQDVNLNGYRYFVIATVMFFLIYSFFIYHQRDFARSRDKEIENHLLSLRTKYIRRKNEYEGDR
jgi:FtsH-binding integral membrane protein